MPSIADLIALLDQKSQEIDAIKRDLVKLAKGQEKAVRLHTKRVIKEGMDGYFAGAKCPYPARSDDADLWRYGFALSKDAWKEAASAG